MIARKRRPAPTTARHVCRTAGAVPISSPCTIVLENAHQTLQAVSHPLGSYLEYSS